jgi:hypothetical protein
MTTDELDHRIRRLSRAIEEKAEALLELELDQTRQLLEKSALTGATASAWETVSAGLAGAWEAKGVLEGHLDRVRTVRGRKARLGRDRMVELEELLEGHTLGAPPARRSPVELVKRCFAAIADARRLIESVSQAWDAFVPRLTTANATLRACADLLEELGVTPGPALAEARRELARLTGACAGDPLSVAPESVAALEGDVASVRAEAERLRDLRADADGRLAEARGLLAEARRAEEDAREAHRVALAKISGADLPRPASLPGDLEDELDRIVALARSGAWREADDALRRWGARTTSARGEAQRVAAANRAPIALRDELRGRLAAYQAKAQRLRLLEDAALAALHARAYRILHTAPTDLGEAGDALRRYQEGLSQTAEREVVR